MCPPAHILGVYNLKIGVVITGLFSSDADIIKSKNSPNVRERKKFQAKVMASQSNTLESWES